MKTDDRARFKHIGEKGDKDLNKKTVSIAGIGGAGAIIASILARENINLRLVDKGRVEEADMHRLGLFYDEDITKFKVKQAKARLQAINPSVHVKSFHEEVTPDNLFLLKGDVIVDSTNAEEANPLIVKHAKNTSLVIVRYSGSAGRVLVLQKRAPAKLLEKLRFPGLEKEGVFGPITTMTGSVAASQILKVLLGEKGSYLIELDAWTGKMKVKKV